MSRPGASSGMIYSLWIINKSGGLVYSKDFRATKALEVNMLLKIAGMFHAMHAISKQFAPQSTADECSGIETIEADGFRFSCFESASGVKFCCSTAPELTNASAFLEAVYVVYADYVLKNPFYDVDQFGVGQPIRVERFDRKLEELVERWRNAP
eukprot:TRINITY_DN10479_c0_g3_i1.p2 TRINITY_DN10479_c0_g3~~TRINITY_DN10479_c0_g3_i1.p2  ORF type:complete len:154 (+),score=59.24 TRINITY_DN10479_c0_g3_i1:107-568(+)